MGHFQASVVLPRPRALAFDFLRVPSNLMKLLPEKSAKHLEVRFPELLHLGSCMEFNIHAMGKQFHIIHEITDLLASERIVATQQKGPFKLWVHEQQFTDVGEGETLLTSSVRFEPPGGLLGFIVTRKQVLAYLEEWIGKTHELLRQSMAQPHL